MGKRSFFTFALGTAAAVAAVSLIKKKGGLHLSFDVGPSELGRSAAEWKAEQDGPAAAAEPEGNGETETE
jgi:hypothetical protein